MKYFLCVLATVSLATAVMADDLEDHYTQLKDAQAKRDPAQVKKLAVETAKLVHDQEAAGKPADMSDADWKQRVAFDKEVGVFAEYALATTAIASPAHVEDLTEALLQVNPKSQYLSVCSAQYLEALGKQGSEKQLAGAQKILAGDADNADALGVLASGYASSSPAKAAGYANRLVAAMKTKSKPEGESEADWQSRKNAMLGNGYYIAGASACATQGWLDCEKDLEAALPFINRDQRTLGIAYFYLGLADYQIGRLTSDRPKMQAAQKYSEQSAAISGPMQQQAYKNAQVIKAELAKPLR